MATQHLHPLVRQWFESRFGTPTEAQAQGWPAIAAGQHTLIAAPTGSGKTLAAFLTALDSLVRQALEPAQDSETGGLPDATQVVYVSPLKALANDIQRNLPLAQIQALAEGQGTPLPEIRVAVRTGDTPAKERSLHAKHPPHVLITTPESLFILLTSERGRKALKSTRTLILDELHALVPNKRGAHLALSVERLCHLAEQPITRIGLSATQKPVETVARFLTGTPVAVSVNAEEPEESPSFRRKPESRDVSRAPASAMADAAGLGEGLVPVRGEALEPRTKVGPQSFVRPSRTSGRTEEGAAPPTGQEEGVADAVACTIVDIGHRRAMDVAIELPDGFELGPIATHELWAQVLDQIAKHVEAHRSTLLFVNTRRLVERVAHLLSERLGEENVVAHHGSLSRETRFEAEQRLKAGTVKVCVATASLELGIDVGDVDFVCQIGSPRNISVALQRIGRSGHWRGGIPKGRLFPLTRDELVETAALLRAIQAGKLDALSVPPWPLDVLAQQIVAACVTDQWPEDALYDLVRRAYPYRDLPREQFDAVVGMLSEGIANRWGRGSAYLHRDGVNHILKARRGARLAAITSGGAIPDTADYLVLAEPEGGMVGTVNEDFAIESMAGDIFLLGNTAWKIRRVESGIVRVESAVGQSPTIPFWLGEAPGRTLELSEEVSAIRQAIDERLLVPDTAVAWLMEVGVGEDAASQIVEYIAEGKRVLGVVPTADRIIAERFFDEAGGMQLVVHSPWGSRINRAWGLALRKRFCRSFDFELQAAATDEGINISLGPQHSFPVEEVFRYVKSNTAEEVLLQAVLQAPVFATRWRWTASRALALLRQTGGKRVPTPIQRMRSDDLLAAVFPAAAACQDNAPAGGDIEPPDHPLVFETLRDCLTEALDIEGLKDLLARIERGEIEVYGKDTVQPSAFSHQLLNAMPYAFLDDAPLEERRARAVNLRRALPEDARDLGALDPDAIAEETANAWPAIRDADELHDALLSLGVLTPEDIAAHAEDPAEWHAYADTLAAAGRLRALVIPNVGNGADASDVGAHRRAPERPPIANAADSTERTFWLATEREPLVQAAYPEHRVNGNADGRDGKPRLDSGLCRNDDGNVQDALSREDAILEILRGRVEATGPFTASEMAQTLALPESDVRYALAHLVNEGIILEGTFRPAFAFSPPPEGEGQGGGAPQEYCDRRILARIHRATIGRLRREIEPVPVATLIRFLLEWQHATPGSRVSGEAGLLEAIEQLQGFEAAAAVWEKELLPARVKDFSPAMLDALCFSGDLAWGRFARRANAAQPASGLSRNGPVSIALREDVPWLLDPPNDESGGSDGETPFTGAAADILEYLETSGASFYPDIVSGTRRLPSEVEDGLWVLVAAGRVTADGFGALRGLVSGLSKRVQRQSRFSRRGRVGASSGRSGSRWSLLRPASVIPSEATPTPVGGRSRGISVEASALANATVIQGASPSVIPAEAGIQERSPDTYAQPRVTASALPVRAEALEVRTNASQFTAAAPNTTNAPATTDDLIELRAAQLLRRYGVVTRDLLAREPLATAIGGWRMLARAYRRAEARGEVRGGRFVAGLIGEQFALPEAVDALRAVHKRAPSGETVRISACDPLNLAGILTPGPRIPAVPGNEVVYRDGVPVQPETAPETANMGIA